MFEQFKEKHSRSGKYTGIRVYDTGIYFTASFFKLFSHYAFGDKVGFSIDEKKKAIKIYPDPSGCKIYLPLRQCNTWLGKIMPKGIYVLKENIENEFILIHAEKL